MGESMTGEREIEQAKKWRQTNWYDSVPPLLDEALAAYGQEKFEAGERLGREEERKECVASLNDRVALAKYMQSYSQDVSPEVSKQVKQHEDYSHRTNHQREPPGARRP